MPTIVYTTATGRGTLSKTGVEIVRIAACGQGSVDVAAVLKDLAGRGVTRLLVEGGAAIHASFLNSGHADRLEIFSAPIVLGGAARAAIDMLGARGLGEMPRFRRTGSRRLGADMLESFAAGA
jgi:diaminohydroxyphosphoribosylaminopyrimidine deaminase/5-amino-6-(5-phosphoribosylamino)uracil reductase